MAREFAKKFYKSKAWQQTRTSYIARVHGLCERCQAKGKIKPGYIVHHKTYITPQNINDPNITLNHSNLEYVCLDCHNDEHFDTEVTRDDVMFDENGDVVKRE
jgi:5-methylcytosine-specific restriction protein A